LELPGGGGWGNPLERPRELVDNDLRQGLVSPEHARSAYGYEGDAP
jgi:N-methylhydantoinase B